MFPFFDISFSFLSSLTPQAIIQSSTSASFVEYLTQFRLVQLLLLPFSLDWNCQCVSKSSLSSRSKSFTPPPPPSSRAWESRVFSIWSLVPGLFVFVCDISSCFSSSAHFHFFLSLFFLANTNAQMLWISDGLTGPLDHFLTRAGQIYRILWISQTFFCSAIVAPNPALFYFNKMTKQRQNAKKRKPTAVLSSEKTRFRPVEKRKVVVARCVFIDWIEKSRRIE